MKYFALTCLLLSSFVCFNGCSHHASMRLPGNDGTGTVLLSNGWHLSPAGSQIAVGDLPLNMIVSPDGRYAIITLNGDGKEGLEVVDLQLKKVTQTMLMKRAWVGLQFFDKARKVIASGGNEHKVFIYDFIAGKLKLSDSIIVGAPWPKQKLWLAGLDINESSSRLYVTARQSNELYELDLETKSVIKSIPLPEKPYTCLSSKYSDKLYVSLWGGAAVVVVDRKTLRITSTISTGSHPTDMVESPDGNYLYVANANENSVSVIDLAQNRVVETLNASLGPNLPPGSTPNGVTLTEDGKTLYIANADNNCLAVMDVTTPGHSVSRGFIPTGWYPTAVRIAPATGQIVVCNGKGGTSKANPNGPNPYAKDTLDEYIARLLKGTVSVIPPPSQEELAIYSAMVYKNCPIAQTDSMQKQWPAIHPVIHTKDHPSPIKHVFYIIKENRTYDQVFGDMPEGNGDPSLCLFPDSVTPNLHALAREFVLLDNFYGDAEVSADGHNWSNGAYATDYVEKSWPTSYSGRGGDYEYEGGYPIAYPFNGYMWDNCLRNNVTFRSYGEFAHGGKTKDDPVMATIKSLEGHVAPGYRSWDLDYSDLDRVKAWMSEFEQYEKNGDLPQYMVFKLPNDHTWGTSRNKLTPRAYMAQNDLAVGKLVERITNSPYWKESAIFIIEDDAQDGADHVDAHRMEALVVSPYTKRHFVDHTMYSTSSMIRTMEEILKLPPMSQYDAAASPMFNSFTNTLDLTPYAAKNATYNLQEINPSRALGQLESEQLDFSREDAVPEQLMNKIVWQSVYGESKPVPSPVRSAFVKTLKKADDDDD
ncbi:MAG: bifunctional YncE family protein/alkaline phosphatase family protein [Ignavibacteria bacterium]|nr:bifunctional YncE family protein/alkaline phosphatase family protein [Ignavibacteria bacterium]